ncbi:hypothetical protein A2801_00395 [Candidatus Woesebacteria bacterium RIFCSPHIGHO2_01_FULL_41_10]|uniref:PDZ domain-containing protein n=1 Tax=Candidatus Woesebacteria bacterium RIFCSPHIGHO2_01_FULL_41_10 TaxID=1802500 RepID=A0A1F7YRK3_9BACT|nr:MAG: hypothetical protein A2801_00395 [Candidatus Woesebacteria bacterium RIFCSPHIGHO2_01_FULL_41_10]
MFENIIAFAIAIAVLSLLILVHELGHFVAARLIGVWVEEFGIGLPPRAIGKKIGKTIYSINWLPFGGFVRMHGEEPDKKPKYPELAFIYKPKMARIFVAVAGVFMNFALAIVVYATIMYMLGAGQGIVVVKVAPESPAAVSQIQSGDQILSIAGKKVYESYTFPETIAINAGKDVSVGILREGQTFTVPVFIREDAPEGQGLLGVTFDNAYMPIGLEKIALSWRYGVTRTIQVSGMMIDGIASMFGQIGHGKVPAGVAGPAGVTAIFAFFAKRGLIPLMDFAALVSVNLALINLIPFPPLDGSRVMFVLIEAIVGKKRLPKYEMLAYNVGMAVILGLVILLTVFEIPKIISAGSLNGFIDTLVSS